jgi:hypothetical protein
MRRFDGKAQEYVALSEGCLKFWKSNIANIILYLIRDLAWGLR